MTTHFEINDNFIAEQNQQAKAWLEEDYEHLGKQLQRRGVNIEDITAQAQSFQVAVPSGPDPRPPRCRWMSRTAHRGFSLQRTSTSYQVPVVR